MSLELGGGQSLMNAKGVRGQSWQNSETALEQKTGRPLTSPLSSMLRPQSTGDKGVEGY